MTVPDTDVLADLAAQVRAAGGALAKGHATENDVVLLADPGGRIPLTAEQVVALANRRAGVGGDGVIRAVPRSALPDAERALVADPRAEWFMDHRAADGSTAPLSGNGLRLFAAFLAHRGLVDLPDGGSVVVGTRAGAFEVHRRGERLVADLSWSLPGGWAAAEAGSDVGVAVAGVPGLRPGLRVDVAGPQTVVALGDVRELAAADLTRAPLVEPAPPRGTSIGLVVALGEQEIGGRAVGVLRMRAHGLGVGEPRSSGTGACAAALAVRTWAGPTAPAAWRVLVPGGELDVRVVGDRVHLGGRVRIIADVRLVEDTRPG